MSTASCPTCSETGELNVQNTSPDYRPSPFAPARALAMALVVVALAGLAGLRVHAQDFFYEAYDSGIREFKQGNLENARRLFERALKLDPKQSRRRLFYGRRFEEYLPEYYLALISVREKQPERARVYLQDLERQGLLKPGDTQYATLTSAINATTVVASGATPSKPTLTLPTDAAPPATSTPAGRGNTESSSRTSDVGTAPTEKPVARADPPTIPPPVPLTVDPGRATNPPPASAPPSAGAAGANAAPAPTAKPLAVDWQKVSTEVNNLLDAGQFDRAWEATKRAATQSGGGGQVPALSKRIVDSLVRTTDARLNERDVEAAGRLVEMLDRIAPASPVGVRLHAAIDLRLETMRVERESFKNLMMGNYQKVQELTAPLVDARQASERILFYAACGRAGMYLMGAGDSESLRAEARRLFAEATRSRQNFQKDEGYLSPEIVGFLRTQ